MQGSPCDSTALGCGPDCVWLPVVVFMHMWSRLTLRLLARASTRHGGLWGQLRPGSSDHTWKRGEDIRICIRHCRVCSRSCAGLHATPDAFSIPGKKESR